MAARWPASTDLSTSSDNPAARSTTVWAVLAAVSDSLAAVFFPLVLVIMCSWICFGESHENPLVEGVANRVFGHRLA